jgi:mannose-6-phosphate isomerase-like protein (cupin superfamily)
VQAVNIAEKFNKFDDYWSPRILAEFNDSHLKIAKLKGEFVWHHHANEDELFLVIRGQLRIKLRDGEIRLGPGEFAIVPKGVEHQPVAEQEVQVLLVEPKSTLNTGNVTDGRTIANPQWV